MERRKREISLLPLTPPRRRPKPHYANLLYDESALLARACEEGEGGGGGHLRRRVDRRSHFRSPHSPLTAHGRNSVNRHSHGKVARAAGGLDAREIQI